MESSVDNPEIELNESSDVKYSMIQNQSCEEKFLEKSLSKAEESYSEEEVFFGAVSKKEAIKIAKLGNRRTEILNQIQFSETSASTPIKSSMQELRETETTSNYVLEDETAENISNQDLNDSISDATFENNLNVTHSPKHYQCMTINNVSLSPKIRNNSEEKLVNNIVPVGVFDIDSNIDSSFIREEHTTERAEKEKLNPQNVHSDVMEIGVQLKNKEIYDFSLTEKLATLPVHVNVSSETENKNCSDLSSVEGEEDLHVSPSKQLEISNVAETIDNNSLTEISFGHNASSCSKNEEEDCPDIVSGSVELKYDSDTSEKIMISDSLDKKYESCLKRQSYFTSLEVINVDDTKMFEDFCIEDESEETQMLREGLENIESLGNDTAKDKTSDSSAENICPEFTSKVISESFHGSNGERSLSSNYNTDESSLYPSSSIYSDRENPNYGMLLSSCTNQSYTEEKQNQDCNEHDTDSSSMTNVELPETSNSPESDKLPQIKIPEIEIEYSDESPPSFSPPSPERNFNDTIEEMELLLKYGINYFEDKNDNQNKETNNTGTNSLNLDACEESIVSPVNKTSVSSTNSIQSFNPNFDSTPTSTENAGKVVTENIEISNESSQCGESQKKLPPPKPPRNDFSSEHLLKTCPNQPIDSESLGRTPCLGKRLKIPRKKITPINSPIVKNLFQTNLLNIPTQTNLQSRRNESHHLKPLNLLKMSPTSHTPSHCVRTPISHKVISSNACKTAKTIRTLPQNHHQPFLTPQCKSKASTVSKLQKTPLKYRGLSIVSPVAKYLQDNPPPPLITTVKPRYRISPFKVSHEELIAHTKVTKSDFKENLDESSIRRKETLKKIDDDIRKLALKVNGKSPLREVNLLSERDAPVCKREAAILPSSIYHHGTNFQLENKENLSKKREIPSDRPPPSILKHTGRMKIHKDSVVLEGDAACEAPWGASPLPPPAPVAMATVTPSSAARDSFMEVSVHEPHSVHHTNTLH